MVRGVLFHFALAICGARCPISFCLGRLLSQVSYLPVALAVCGARCPTLEVALAVCGLAVSEKIEHLLLL